MEESTEHRQQSKLSARVSKSDLDVWRLGAHPESANGRLYEAALSLFEELDRLQQQLNAESDIQYAQRQEIESLTTQRDALANVLLKAWRDGVFVDANLDLANEAEAALCAAGGL